MATTTNYSWTTPDDTDLVKDGAAAIRTLGTAIDSTVFTNAGNAIAKTIVDAKGDLIVATGADTVSRLAVGTNDYLLTADSSTATGLKWAAAPSGGKVLQVVQATYSTSTTIASTSYTDTGLTASITPSSTNSKILVFVNQLVYYTRSANQLGVLGQLLRGATVIHDRQYYNFDRDGAQGVVERNTTFNLVYLDSPSTTSSTTYKTQGSLQTTSNSASSTYQANSTPSVMILMEIGA